MIKKLLPVILAFLLLLASCESRTPQGEVKQPEKKQPAKDQVQVVEQEDDSTQVTEDSPLSEILQHNQALDDQLIQFVQFEDLSNQPTATIKTTRGNIKIALFPEYAPFAVERFYENVEAGAYNGADFGKISENLYIETTNTKSTPSPVVEDAPLTGVEQSLKLWNFRGAVILRENQKESPKSSLATFAIVQAKLMDEDIFNEMQAIGYPNKVIDKYKEVSGVPSYDGRFTVFGQVVEGMDIIDEITATKVDESFFVLEDEEPTSILSVTITGYPLEETTE